MSRKMLELDPSANEDYHFGEVPYSKAVAPRPGYTLNLDYPGFDHQETDGNKAAIFEPHRENKVLFIETICLEHHI